MRGGSATTTKISKCDTSARRSARGEVHLAALCACVGASLLAAACGEALVDACCCCLDVVSDWFVRWTDPAAWYAERFTP